MLMLSIASDKCQNATFSFVLTVPQLLQALPLPHKSLILCLFAAPRESYSWIAVALPGRHKATTFDLIMLVALTKSACVFGQNRDALLSWKVLLHVIRDGVSSPHIQ